MMLLAAVLLLSACGNDTAPAAGSSPTIIDRAADTEAAVTLPRKEDFAPAPTWDGKTEPDYTNGPWAQSRAVFDALAEQAEAYDEVKPERTFSLAVHDPINSGPAQIATGWANAVTVATQGRVKINVGYSGTLSGATSSLDDMKQGLIDFVWTLPCYFKGYLPLTNVIQNPSLNICNGTAASYAMWELYNSSPEIQAEAADDGVLLFTCANCTSPLSYKGTSEIQSTDEIFGNIRANNGPAQIFVTAAGANVFSCPIGEVYNNIQHGIIDYLVTDWNGIDSFALSDPGVLNYYLNTNVGCSVFVLLANRDIWNTIDAKLQAAILSASGDYMLNLVSIWDYWEALGRYHALANGGDIFSPSESLNEELNALYAQTAQTWISQQADPEIARQVYGQAEQFVAKYNEKYAW